MDGYLSFSQNRRNEVKDKIKQTLLKEKKVVFSFVFGSFLDSPSFRDIDIAVYVDKLDKSDIFDYENNFSQKIAKECELPFDIFEVKILNFAPSNFLNNIFSRGQMLFCRDSELLSSLIENTSLDALANEYVAYQSLKELVPA
ncbi:MAG: nucleotidyltransferase domain-containing protein [Candidatus Paceibacterota bacterium]